MKEISQEEFEENLRTMLEEGKTKTQIKSELGLSSYRDLNKRVQRLSITNPELYMEYIEKYPYAPKTRKDLDIIEIGIEFLRDEKNMDELAKQYGTGKRTIRRKLDALKSSSKPEERQLYDLCRALAYNHSKNEPNSRELELKIEELMQRLEEGKQDIEKPNNLEIRKRELKEIERQYIELCKTMTKTEAAKKMGTTRVVIDKQLQELHCIETEINARNKKNGFHESLRAKVEPTTVTQNTNPDTMQKTPEKQIGD